MKVIQPRNREYIEDYSLNYDYIGERGWGFSFPCDKHGNIILNGMHEAAITNLLKCKFGNEVGTPYMRDYSRWYTNEEVRQCDNGTCEGDAYFSRHCGTFTCNDCGMHEGLARCYCGWSQSGNNGRQELLEMGENIYDD